MTSVRRQLGDKLAADWAGIPALAGLTVLATERVLEAIHKDTALIRQTSIGRAPAAPQGAQEVRLLLTLISAHEDLDRAADDLDSYVEAALAYLPMWFRHDDATSVAYADRLAYDIPLIITAKKGA